MSGQAWAADRPEPGDELAALSAVLTAPELQQQLLLHDPRGSTTDPGDAVAAFCRVHAAGEPGAAQTALLLLTAWRWRRCTAPLLSLLVASGLLADADLDELAEIGLFDEQAAFAVPAEVFSGVEIALPAAAVASVAAADATDDPRPADDPPHAVMVRPMQPPLRRWSAGHLLRHDPGRIADVREQACRLDVSSAAAAMRGVLDALDVLPPETAGAVLHDACRWPHKSVRLPALQQMAERGEPAEAARLARADRDASIRAAAPTMTGPATLF